MKFLLVSDDALFCRLAANKLEKWGYRADVETTAAAALERFRREPFRVVVTGWDLEGMSGPELCKRIRAIDHGRYTYVIMYTSRQAKEDMLTGFEAGADDYLVRPFNSLEFRLRLKAAKRLLNLEDDLRREAGVDSTTGLVNDSSFRQFFGVLLAQARRTASNGVLMFVRIDNHQDALAAHGVVPASKLVAEVANAVKRSVRDSDLVARISEDEFCVILQNTYRERCGRVCRQVLSLAENMSLHVDDIELHPRISISTIDYPVEERSTDEILSLPDRIPFEA